MDAISKVAPPSFSYSTHLGNELIQIFKTMEEKLDLLNDDTNISDLSECECVPLQIQSDASGKLKDGGLIQLVAPSRMFFKLPNLDEHKHYMKQYIHEWRSNRESKCVLSKCTSVARAIGVRESPDLVDWIRILQEIGEAASQENNLSPNEKKAAEFSLMQFMTQLSKCKQEKPKISGLWLFDYNQSKLTKAENLVWADRIELKHRCEKMMYKFGLSFSMVDKNDKLKLDFALLCKHSTLRPLSELVSETVTHDLTDTKPEKHEQCLEDLIQSRLFARCHCACLNKTFDKNIHDKVHEILSSINFKWTSTELETILYAQCGNNSSIFVEDSQEEKMVFLQNNTLWLQSDILNSENENDLFDEISVSLFQLLDIIPQISSQRHNYFTYILKNYRNWPDRLPLVMEKKGIALTNKINNHNPGSLLQLPMHMLVCQSMLFTFNSEEMVAILGEKIDGVQGYKYAKVKSFLNEAIKPEKDLGQQSYRILVANEITKIMKHWNLQDYSKSFTESLLQ